VTFCTNTALPNFNAEKPKKDQAQQPAQKGAKKAEAAAK